MLYLCVSGELAWTSRARPGAEGLRGAPPPPADASAGLTRQVPRGEAAAGVHHSDRSAGRAPARLAAVALSCSSPAEPPAGSPCFLQQVAETAARGYGDLDLLVHAHDRRRGLLDLVTANVARRIRNSSKRSATCPVPPLPRSAAGWQTTMRS
jgi:hypothetical protein